MAEETEALVSTERPRIWRYTYAAGPVRSRFLLELKDNQRIMGTRCPSCNRVYVPAKPTCVLCFSELDEWVEVSNTGTVLTYTVIAQTAACHRKPAPFAYGIIQLDGADTGLTHFLGEVEHQDLRVGMRVEAVFREAREGSILDIKYFRPFSESL
jgi:uncharacterized OB-fold protein